MIPIVAVINQKGGVGKTLTVSLLAQYFALIRGLRVGVADLDMQCNISDELVGMELSPNAIGGQLPPQHPDYTPDSQVCERSSIADCFYGQAFLPYSSWINKAITKSGCVDVFLGHPQKLEQINTTFAREDDYIDPRAHRRLRELFHGEDFTSEYDIIILDLGPSRNPIFRAALRAATHVIVPFTPESKSIQGINAMLQAIRQENYARTNDMEELKLIGLLPNKVRYNTKLHEKILAHFLKEHPDLTFPQDAWLSLLTAFPERDTKDSRPRSVFELPESDLARKQALKMCEYVSKSIFDKD